MFSVFPRVQLDRYNDFPFKNIWKQNLRVMKELAYGHTANMEQSGVPRTRQAWVKGTLIITVPHWPHSNPVISMPSLGQCILEQGQQMTTRIIRVFAGSCFWGDSHGRGGEPWAVPGSTASLLWGVRGIWGHSLKLQQLNWSPHPSHRLVPFCGRVFSATSWGGRANNTMVISISQESKLSLMWVKCLPWDHRQSWA